MAIKEELANIVGAERVIDDPETLDAYSRDLSFVKPVKPRLIVKPGNADEVQAIVRWANKTATPLVPVSSGTPRFHGDTVPGVPGAVIVDLSGMKKIMRIDRRNRVAMIEPGVTYDELQPELAKEGMRLTTPLAPRAGKSIVASLLEREPTLIPRQLWASLDPLRCNEIIWGDGNKLVTGDAGMWSSMEDAWKRKQAPAGSTGPGQADFYRFVSAAQGSMGIVTWASVKCEILPAPHKLFFVPAQKPDDLFDFTYRLLKYRYADELLLLNNSSLAYILGDSPDAVKALMKKLPPWLVLVGIAGRSILPEERVAYQEKDILNIAGEFGLKLEASVPGAGGEETLKALTNTSREPFWKLGYKAGYQDIIFMTTLNRTSEFIATVKAVAQANGYPASDIGVHIQPMHQGSNVQCEFIMPFDRDDSREAAKMQKLLTEASEKLIEQGAFFARPYGIWADMAYKRDAQSTRVLKKLKGIFDPNNILNPGKLCF